MQSSTDFNNFSLEASPRVGKRLPVPQLIFAAANQQDGNSNILPAFASNGVVAILGMIQQIVEYKVELWPVEFRKLPIGDAVVGSLEYPWQFVITT
jgi:hypothetical protein